MSTEDVNTVEHRLSVTFNTVPATSKGKVKEKVGEGAGPGAGEREGKEEVGAEGWAKTDEAPRGRGRRVGKD